MTKSTRPGLSVTAFIAHYGYNHMETVDCFNPDKKKEARVSYQLDHPRLSRTVK